MEKGVSFHKKCFTCRTCTRPLSDKLQVFIGFDNEVYCKVCYPKITHTPLPMDPNDKSKLKSNDPDACPRCSGKVFEAEKISSKGKFYHKECFTCQNCDKILTNSSCFELGHEIFCKTCYNDANSDGKNFYMDRNSIQALKATHEDDLEVSVSISGIKFNQILVYFAIF